MKINFFVYVIVNYENYFFRMGRPYLVKIINFGMKEFVTNIILDE